MVPTFRMTAIRRRNVNCIFAETTYVGTVGTGKVICQVVSIDKSCDLTVT